MRLSKKLFLFFFLVCILLSSANFVLAFNLEVHYPAIFGRSINDTSTFAEFICYFFGLIMDLAFFISVIVIAWGGVYYLFTLGVGRLIDPAKGISAPDEAKEWIKAGVTGTLIIACASLIAYTINPNLGTCKLDFLPQTVFDIIPVTVTPPDVPVATYSEIPLGVLTENLLTRKMDCYGFDQEGNPIDGEQITADLAGPTFIEHDRADCMVQLIDGAQKKAQAAAALSDEIIKLMNECSCAGKCDPTYPCQGQPGTYTDCPNGTCIGPCAGAACQQPSGSQDCCPTTDPITGLPLTTTVKQQIEHGPINMAFDVGGHNDADCQTESAEYAGLDEFRCPNPNDDSTPCSDVPNFVEEQVELSGKTITIINQDKWAQLNLIQQLTYFKEKIDGIKESIENDKALLDQARGALIDCYLAVPSVDFLKIFQGTSQQNKIILKNPALFSDPVTNEPVNGTKYCAGFNYANSSCFKKCNDECPDTSPGAINLYGNTSITIEQAYSQRPCIYNSADPSLTFEECISSCQVDCETACSDRYLTCSNEYNFCADQCVDNSQCVLDNYNNCLLGDRGADWLRNCANEITDQGNTDYCVNRAYLCKNGSNQYAGYPDCTEPSSAVDCSSIDDKESCESNTECSWSESEEECFQNYSASFFYDNSDYEKCYIWENDIVSPYSPADEGVCHSNTNPDEPCLNLCPEVTKCPASSRCPYCPCDRLSDPDSRTEPLSLYFSVPNESVSNPDEGPINAGDAGYTTREQPISAHQMVGTQCNEYSYNDDPLTFYCEDSWWDSSSISKQMLSENPIGEDRVCKAEGEIPVGQTVDDAKKWAEKLISDSEKMQEKIQTMLDQMEKAGSAYQTDPVQNYCKCNARFDFDADNNHNGEPICQTGYQYDQGWVEEYDEYGDPIGGHWDCSCAFKPCEGRPCQQLIDYLSELWNDYKKLKEDFIAFYTTMLKEPRSDIMKELTYSRQETDNCSLISNTQGPQAILLNCTRVEDEVIAPGDKAMMKYNGSSMPRGCYGGRLGQIFDLTDNWFCCHLYNNEDADIINPEIQ